jgi:uncharacterized protein (DUF1697 family)
MTRYVALLRGINVGGNNLIKMVELKLCFEELGFSGVSTYIQSGNVLFAAGRAAVPPLIRRIEAAIEKTFGCAACVVLRSREQMQDIVKRAPKGFGTMPEKRRYDVIFLKEPLTAAAAMKDVPLNPEVDEVVAGKGELYHSRLISKASQSRLSKLVSLPMYKNMTIRNWNTTSKLLHLMSEK